MCDVYELSERLANTLSSHKIYIDYLDSKNKIEKNSQLKNLLDEYRRLQFEISFKKNNGQNIEEWKESQLANSFSQIQAAPEAYKFLCCENDILNLLSDVFNTINTKVPIDLDF